MKNIIIFLTFFLIEFKSNLSDMNIKNSPMESGYNENTNEHYVDFDWNQFSQALFKKPPQDPFTFRIEFLDELDLPQVSQLLGQTLLIGIKELYDKELSEITPMELDKMRQYFKSIGFNIESKLNQSIQYIPELKKTLPVNHYTYQFIPCQPILDIHNHPEKIIP